MACVLTFQSVYLARSGGICLSTQEAEAGRSLISKLAWSTWRVPEQPELLRETLCQRQNQKKRKRLFIIVAKNFLPDMVAHSYNPALRMRTQEEHRLMESWAT